ncbi:ferredoxin:thioredoxin reductase [Candidatus Parcubacteria bacterium]|nr:ferredoxin:thioredoxin reductase [Candidatus Parcubacteria bacterium]
MNNDPVENLIEDYKKYAEENGLKLNPDKKIIEVLIKKLLENEEKYGEKYCPCRFITGDCEKDKKKICPCVFMDSEIKKQGHCHCSLFVK